MSEQSTRGRDDSDLRERLSALTLEQKASLTAGADYWRTVAIPEAGVPPLKVSDGPVGARGDLSAPTTSTCFPCGSAVGATWDVELAAEFGIALAEEAKTKGAHVLLAPTVNLHRHPFAGRNFECMSEDPELTGRIASSIIKALQSQGIGASLKHFVANDQETERMSISSEVDERTLRELYLRPFEAAVAEANPWTIMASYNKVNGTFASENPTLLNGLLKDEWQWDGAVISDWWATHSGAEALKAGLDLEMPGPALWMGPAIAKAVENGDLEEADLDEAVLRLFRLSERTGRFEDPELQPERSESTPERTALARRMASSAAVLLRNNGALPLDAQDLKSVAVIGPGADPGFLLGGGSALVWPHRRITPLAALQEQLPDATLTWSRGCAIGRLAAPIHPDLMRDGGWLMRYWRDPIGEGEPVYVETTPEARYSYFGRKLPGITNPFSMTIQAETVLTPDVSGPWTIELTCAGTVTVTVDGREVISNPKDEPQGRIFADDLPTFTAQVELTAGVAVTIAARLNVDSPGCMPHLYLGALAPDPRQEIEKAAALAAASDAAILFVGTGPDFESEGFDRSTLSLPGAQDDLVRAVVAAQPNTVVVVSAAAPVDLPWRDEVPALVLNWFGGQEAGPAIADVLLGHAEPGGRLPVSFPVSIEDTSSHTNFPGADGRVTYSEGLLIGHRWHEHTGVAPAFAFGEGGSYTTIELADPSAVVRDDGVIVTVTATNTGARAGSEVVQVYSYGAVDELAPPIQLAGFAKTHLEAGASAEVIVTIPLRALSFWDTTEKSWHLPSGPRELRIGRSSRQLALSVTIDLEERLLPTPQR